MINRYVTLGQTIQQKREACGMTQDELSDRAGLAYSTLAKIERGVVKNPSVFTISSLASVLGCSVEDLLAVERPSTTTPVVASDTFLFCDLNGVLVRFFHRAFVSIAEEHGLTVDKVETAFWHYNDAANRGEMSLEAFNTVMAEQLGIDSFDWHKNYLESIEPISEMQRCIEEISKIYPVGILSNIHSGLIDKLMKMSLLPDIDYACIVDSSVVHAIKPEQKMYEIAEKMAGAKGEQILFVDDSRANLIAAERLGWRVMWFDDYRPADSVKRLKQALQM